MSDHQRLQRSVLARAEKRALMWLAERMPRSINSDHLSLLGLASMLAVGAGFAAARVLPRADLLIVVALAANWFGDSLDGTLARVRNQQRPRYGFYVDHAIDLAGTCFLFGGLAMSGIMSPVIALAVLAGYLLVCAESYLGTHAAGVFRLSFLGIGPTELRIVLAAGAVYAVRKPWVVLGPWGGPFRLFDAGGVVTAAGLVAAFVICALGRTAELYRAEPLPVAGKPDGPGARVPATGDIIQRAT